jgi:hypothetical protein
MGNRRHLMATAPVKTGIGHIQQLGHKGRVFANDVTNSLGGSPLIPTQLEDLQRQRGNRRESLAIFYTLQNLGIHYSLNLRPFITIHHNSIPSQTNHPDLSPYRLASVDRLYGEFFSE